MVRACFDCDCFFEDETGDYCPLCGGLFVEDSL